MTTEKWNIGSISITKIDETSEWAPLDLMLEVLPDADRDEIDRIEWLRPTYLDENKVNVITHSLLVETPQHKIAVDMGIGNQKKRLAPMFNDLRTDFLQRFETVWRPEDVDGVLFTHLHIDHVGWNTVPAGDGWQPTFPNARYFFVRQEFEHWKRFAQDPRARENYTEFGYRMVDAAAVFEDSIEPIEKAGLITWVEPGQTVVPGISLIPTAGHTPGHVSILIEDGTQSAVITGDLLHSPFQIARPDWSAAMDTDTDAAADTRRRFLDRFADTGTLVLGTHFGTPTGGHLQRSAGTYELVPARGELAQ